MKESHPEPVELLRLVQTFFPEAKPYLQSGLGLEWDGFLGAMKLADYAADYSCDPFREPGSPDFGLARIGGFEGDDAAVYRRLLSHARLAPSGRVVVIPEGLTTNGGMSATCQPFVCAAESASDRLREHPCLGRALEMIFIFESGEALLVDHDYRVHWARSKINQPRVLR